MMRRLCFLALAIAAAVCCTREMPSAAPEKQAMDCFVPGVAEVLLSEDGAAVFETKASASVFDELGVVSLERIFPDGGEFDARHKEFGLDRWYRVVYDKNVSRTKASESLSALPGVESVNIPRKKKQCGGTFFNDYYYDYQWNLYNDGNDGKLFKAGADINVEPVWKKFTCGSPNVIVAVVDGYADPDHEDLSGVVLKPGKGGSKNFVAEYDGLIPDEHGTHVSGIIGAVSGNGVGIAGVAGGRDGKGGVKIMSCQIFATLNLGQEDEDWLSGDSAEAIVWAADNGALIVNNSWGYVYDSERSAKDDLNWFTTTKNADRTAIDYFVKYAGCDNAGNQTGLMKGGVVVFAAGNDEMKYGVPSGYDKVIAVGSFDPDYSVSSYSNYGDWVDICAPGGADLDDDSCPYVLSCVPAPDDYLYMCGTSQAAPHVSGVAALLVSYFGGPGFTAAQLTEKLLGGAKKDKVGTSKKKIGPMLDAYGAFTYDGTNPESPIKITTEYTGDYRIKSHLSLTVDYNIEGNDDGKYQVEFESSTGAASADISNNKVKMTVEALKASPGIYSARIIVGRGTSAEVFYPINFEILKNNAPMVTAEFDDVILDVNGNGFSANLDSYFTDPDGEVLNYKVVSTSFDAVRFDVSGASFTLSPSGYGESTVTVTARDARGLAREQSFRVLVRDTSRPVDVYPIPATDVLYVRPGVEEYTDATLISKTGAKVAHDARKVGPFDPLKLDVASLPAGTYTLKLLYREKEETVKVVKY